MNYSFTPHGKHEMALAFYADCPTRESSRGKILAQSLGARFVPALKCQILRARIIPRWSTFFEAGWTCKEVEGQWLYWHPQKKRSPSPLVSALNYIRYGNGARVRLHLTQDEGRKLAEVAMSIPELAGVGRRMAAVASWARGGVVLAE